MDASWDTLPETNSKRPWRVKPQKDWGIIFRGKFLLLVSGRVFDTSCFYHQSYCWWKNSCTTKDDEYPTLFFRVLKKSQMVLWDFWTINSITYEPVGYPIEKNGSPFSRKFSKLSVHGVGWTFFGDAGFPRQHFSHGWNRWNYFLVGR